MRAASTDRPSVAPPLVAALCVAACWTASAADTDAAGRLGPYFRETQNLPTGKGSNGKALAEVLPYAYYPSLNKMDVAIQLTAELERKAGGRPDRVGVLVRAKKTGKRVATGVVPLNVKGYGRALLDVPDFPDGEYSVEYEIGTHKVVSPKLLKRIHFPFEEVRYGAEHKVYPPFEPVQVSQSSIKVVGRAYKLNGFCLFDSIESLGRELLASPVRLVGKTVDGKPIVWSQGQVEGKALHEDEAVFTGEIRSPQVLVKSRALIQEDGCAEVRIRLEPGKDRTQIQSLKLIVPLKDKEMPLFHYIADNAMRLNYAGKTPRGGKIKWLYEPWQGGWIPFNWKVEEPGSDDGVLITAGDTTQWWNEGTGSHRPFLPYVWLGAEERGLAFFMESEEGFITPKDYPGWFIEGKRQSKEAPYYKTSLNRIVRRGDTLAIEVDIFTGPCSLDEPREVTFGFMASPGKPMERGFQAVQFSTGCGIVTCWGGWGCSSKYPANHDWTIVDKIQEMRARGGKSKNWMKLTPEEEGFFRQKAEEVSEAWPGRKVWGNDWYETHRPFFQDCVVQPWPARRKHSGIYFEEHGHDWKTPEWQVFQDEWASVEFNRFQEKQGSWGVFAEGYHDFACYMANEWLKRGISLYFDNTNPKRCYSYRFGPGYYSDDGKLLYGTAILGQRRYYRRIYKLVQKWNQSGKLPYRVDFTIHITNTYTLPFNTWATATLDFESVAPKANPSIPPEPGVPDKSKKPRYQLPWPPDYLRTGTFGRQAGVIPLVLCYTSGHDRHAGPFPLKVERRDWAMGRLHGIRRYWAVGEQGYEPREQPIRTEGRLKGLGTGERALGEFGYGTDEVVEFNYWDEDPFVRVNDEHLKWMALVKKDSGVREYGMLLLQSYSRLPIEGEVAFPGAGTFVEVFSGQEIGAKDGVLKIDLPEHFPTRLYKVRHAGSSRPKSVSEFMERRSLAEQPQNVSSEETTVAARPVPPSPTVGTDRTPVRRNGVPASARSGGTPQTVVVLATIVIGIAMAGATLLLSRSRKGRRRARRPGRGSR